MTYYGFSETEQASCHYTPVLDLGQRIALGFGGKFARFEKFGYNSAISTAEESLVPYGGLANFPLVATYPGAKMEVVSSSADDDGDPVGTGARTVKIFYLTSAGVEKTETVTLNGATAVETVATDIWRINGFRVKTMGSGQGAAGNITLQEIDNAPVFSQILPGHTRASNSQYTVPAGKCLMVTDVTVASGGVTQDKGFLKFKIKANLDCDDVASGINLFTRYIIPCGGCETVIHHLVTPILVPCGTDLVINAEGVAATAGTSAFSAMRGWLITV